MLRRPKCSASRDAADACTRQPARPRLTKSRVCSPVATWNGSVWVVVTVGTSPMREVSGATRAAISSASSRPRRRLVGSSAPFAGPPKTSDCSEKESSMVTKSMPAASDRSTSSVQ